MERESLRICARCPSFLIWALQAGLARLTRDAESTHRQHHSGTRCSVTLFLSGSALHATRRWGAFERRFPWSVVRCSKRISYSLEDVDQAFCSSNFWYLLNYDKMKKFLQNKKGRYSLRQNKPGPRYPPKDICKFLVFKNLFVGWWWLSAAHLKSVKVCMEANVLMNDLLSIYRLRLCMDRPTNTIFYQPFNWECWCVNVLFLLERTCYATNMSLMLPMLCSDTSVLWYRTIWEPLFLFQWGQCYWEV